jgi:hypothetical protein
MKRGLPSGGRRKKNGSRYKDGTARQLSYLERLGLETEATIAKPMGELTMIFE